MSLTDAEGAVEWRSWIGAEHGEFRYKTDNYLDTNLTLAPCRTKIAKPDCGFRQSFYEETIKKTGAVAPAHLGLARAYVLQGDGIRAIQGGISGSS
jgi:hypothetical protein